MTGSDNKKLAWMIVLAAVLVYFGAIWHRPLFAPDEVRYAQIPLEMLRSGSFAVPTFNGLTYFEKPAPCYWLTAGAVKLFGPIPFAVRLPSALFTLLTAAAVYFLGVRAADKRTGAAAALLFLTSGMVFAAGTYAVPDASFVFCVTSAAVLGYFYYMEKSLTRSLLLLFAAGLLLGAGVMIKGLLAPLLAGLLFTGFFFWKKEFRKWGFSLLPVAAGIAVIALPCAFYIHANAPGFWREFILTEHLSRAFTGTGAGDDRYQPFWYYLPIFPAGLLPALLLALPAFSLIRKKAKAFFLQDDLNLFCSSAIVLWFLFFSIVRAKLGTYILPLYPFAALLLARCLTEAVREGKTADISRMLNIFCSLLGGLVVLFAVWHFLPFISWKYKLYSTNELIPAVMTAGILLLWYGMAAREQNIYPERKFLYFCLGTAAVMLSFHHIMPGKIVRRYDRPAFIRRAVLPRLRPGAVVMADGGMAGSAAFVLGRPVRVYTKPGEFFRGLGRAGLEAATAQDLAKMLPEISKNGRQIVVIVNSVSRLKDMPPRIGKTVIRSGKMAAVFYGESTL